MQRIEKTVFISYRRSDLLGAQLISNDLTGNGFDVFFDLQGLRSGDFEGEIFEQIRARAHFLVLLTPSALERCSDPHDLMRCEIQWAFLHRRNVVPIMLNGFSFRAPGIAEQLTAARLSPLARYNGIDVHEIIPDALRRVREFLNVPLDAVRHPFPDSGLLLARISPMAMLPIGIPPNSTVHILSLMPETPSLGFMEVSNPSGAQILWPHQYADNPIPPQLALRCSLTNAVDRAFIDITLQFQVDFKLPRPGGGSLASDPVDSSFLFPATVPIIRPEGQFEFIIANRSTTHIAHVAILPLAKLQPAGENAYKIIQLTFPEVSILDKLRSCLPLYPATVKW
jgi:hypothetical protein